MSDFKKVSVDVVVVGTGAAGYNAACRIKQEGKKSVAIVTEGVNCGTSRNTGSDKQTYYKLGLGGDSPDSVRKMAENLFSCGSVDGDNALCEAALSVRSFMNLCESGVEFPVNRYGEYVGYKTDHDPFARATSAGPLTSKFMTEALQKKATELNVDVYDRLLAVEILKVENTVVGLVCLEIETGCFVVFRCESIILATGGPAGIYYDSVYPIGHTGSTGLALDAGAKAQNLTEWQYGLASTQFRWNVSGTYMQVLPRFVSIDNDGKEHEFLKDYYGESYAAMSDVFLKGYQWPFDSKKVLEGSSVVDLLVYNETVLKGRRVYLDFTKNPFGLDEIDFKKLSHEAYDYLNSSNACFGKPIDRLLKMNTPAVELYKNHGIDITKDYLEVALCAQHCNGGIAVDMWWQTSVDGLFAVGECAGTHGVTRPGGSALNAGQVGSLRAALYVSNAGKNKEVDSNALNAIIDEAVNRNSYFADNVSKNKSNVMELTENLRKSMSECGAAIRNKKKMVELRSDLIDLLSSFSDKVGVHSYKSIYKAYKLKDQIITQIACLTAMIDYIEQVDSTRGSSLYYDKKGQLRDGLGEMFRFSQDKDLKYNSIQETVFSSEKCCSNWRKVRPIPKDDDFFENVWNSYRKNKNIF